MVKQTKAINIRFSLEQANKLNELAAKQGISVKTLILLKCGVIK